MALAPRILEVAFGEDAGPFTFCQIIERLKRYEQVAIARPLESSFKFALRLVLAPGQTGKDEVGRVCEALGIAPGTNVAWNDSAERH